MGGDEYIDFFFICVILFVYLVVVGGCFIVEECGVFLDFGVEFR